MAGMDSDLHLGQIAIRMGLITPKDLPRLLREARAEHVEESAGRAAALGQVLLRRRLISVSDYLHMARHTRQEEDGGEKGMTEIRQAFSLLESGEIDREAFEIVLGKSAELAPLQRPEELTTFGPYELLGEVARGGMGIVYRARDPLGRTVALKVMIEADDDEVRLKRFENEARLASTLDHPNIVSIHDAGRIEGIPYFTMDLIDGESLEDLIEEGRVDRDVAIRAIAVIAEAADHAHERGIVHRDLKPGNIILEKETGEAHVTDFGLARNLSHLTRLTQVGQAVGTPYYMAPEQVRGERDVDGRADVYALGVILYEILTGEVPFDADSPLSLFKKIDAEPLVLAIDPERGIDERIHAIVTRALAKDRDQRYSRGRLLADDLRRYQRGLPPRARADDWRGAIREKLGQSRMTTLAIVLVVAALVVVSIAGKLAYDRLQRSQRQREARAQVVTALEEAAHRLEQGRAALDAEEYQDAFTKGVEGLGALTKIQGILNPPDARSTGARDAFEKGQGEEIQYGLVFLEGKTLVRLSAQDPRRFSVRAEEALADACHDYPDDWELHLLRAELLELVGALPGAIASLDEVLQINPQQVGALVRRGRILLELGRSREAETDLSRALLIDGSNTEALVQRARTLVRLGSLADAQEDAELARSRASHLVGPHLATGEVFQARDRYDQALASYLEAARLAPGDPRPLLQLGRLLWQLGAFEQAGTLFHDAYRLGGSWQALFGQAQVELALFDLTGARDTIQKAQAAVEGAPRGLRPRELAKALTLQGTLELLEDRHEAAHELFDRAVAIDPQAAAPRVWLARLALRAPAPNPSRAASHLPAEDPATSKDPDLLAVRSQLALYEGDLELARDLAERAVVTASRQGRHPRARAALARARIAGQAGPAAVRAACDAAWNEASTSGDLAAHLLSWGEEQASLAGIYRSDVLGESAEALLRASLALDPTRAKSWGTLGSLHLARGEVGAAWKALEKAVSLHPYRPRLAEELARAALDDPRPARLKASLAALGHGIEAGGATPPRLILRASCQMKLEQWQEALVDLERAAKSGTNPELELLRAEVFSQRGRAEDAGRAESTAEELRRTAEKRRETLHEQLSELIAKGKWRETSPLLEEALVSTRLEQDEPLQELILAEARLRETPLAQLEALLPLLDLEGTNALDRADGLLADSWRVPLSLEQRESLVRRAQVGAPQSALAVALAALYDSLLGSADDEWRTLGLEHAEQAVEDSPASLGSWLARAYLRLHTGDSARALRELEVLSKAASSSGLLRFVEAEALAAQKEAGRANVALEKAKNAGLARAAERIEASPFW